MNLKRKLAVAAGALLAPIVVIAVPVGTASAHGYVSSPPSRQANCAQGKVSNCGPIIYEPQSVEGPKGLTSCNGGLSQFAQLADESKNWPASSVNGTVNFTWTLTARHATSTWEYFIGGTKVASFNDGGAQPGATKTHAVNLSGFSGRQKLLARWNIADTANAFYSCVDLQIGGGGNPTTPTTPPTTTSNPPTTTPTTSQPPAGGTWKVNTAYSIGSTVTYGGATYKCITAHTSLQGWEPPNVPALWQQQ
ncbi:lytic polysaccharide monooxygenase [Amycolatopsis sp. cg5]|uniref:lytic polysaccharide monooxygenase n=1 Tax=Amycolatopsis sp. cg5 TaxID=3238802 RepID=UPI003526766F